GLRWPADGPAVLSAETATVANPPFQAPLPIPGQPAGWFWADVPAECDRGFLQLAANAVANSPALTRFLGPVAEQARIAQRLEDAARVAGRVAHDFDNVFQGVTGFASLALDQLPPNTPADKNFREADSPARHGMNFCPRLPQLSRGGQAKPLPAGVSNALAREVARLVNTAPNVRIESEVAADLPAVAIEGGGLQMILG